METREEEKDGLLTEVEKELKGRFEKTDPTFRVPSSAAAPAESVRLDQLALPQSERPRMPFTKDQYLIRDNPQLVAWEREVRRFLRKLSPMHGHRISAVMIYEWVTGIRVADLMAGGGSANADLRKINEVLRFYFGKSYSTYIMGRKVPRAYRVRQGYLITRHRPYTVTLYAEYADGTLKP